MRSNEVFPSDYLKAADITRPVMFVMSHVEMRDLGDDHKPALFFVGQSKSLVLNRTNWVTIADAYGDESDDWQGKQIVLYVDENVRFQGKKTPSIRVRQPKQPTSGPLPAAKTVVTDPPSEEIPF